MLRQVLNVHCALVLSDFESACWPLLLVFQKQILDPLVIDLKHRELDLIFIIRIVIGLDSSEDFITRLRHNAFVFAVAHH